MKYSHKWLQEHLDKPLLGAEELARTITTKSFEVEGVETHEGAAIFDINVLPNRAHDALSHRGMAREIAALFDIPMHPRAILENPVSKGLPLNPSVPAVRVAIEDPKRCLRYIGVRVDGVAVGASPKWLEERIASVGQRSISNIVDLTNFILFDLGQPMHAFDAAKVAGGITVRLAKSGETMTTLDGKDLIFDGTELVIADDEAGLALAGVKGGKKAEVDAETSSIIFECANFDPTETRKTSTKHSIKTDASKRYENGMTSELAGEAVELALSEVQKKLPTAKIGTKSDVYPHPEPHSLPVSVTLTELNGLLGSAMTEKDVGEVLGRLAHAGFAHEAKSGAYVVTPPVSRLDIRIKEDLVEEVGLHYGYDKITPTLPNLGRKGLPNKRLYYANKVRNFLVERGFSEVYTYSFSSDKGDGVEVLNPVGDDRPYMRERMAATTGLAAALMTNGRSAPILGTATVDIFEFGNVFTERDEQFHLALGSNKKKAGLWTSLTEIMSLLGVKESDVVVIVPDGGIPDMCEIDFDASIVQLPEPLANETLAGAERSVIYKAFSKFPHIVRDVALWVPKETKVEDVEAIVTANAGELAQKIYLFDNFEKEDKKSFAFRMVLQSFERTLEDAEANAVYDNVVKALQSANAAWQVRV